MLLNPLSAAPFAWQTKFIIFLFWLECIYFALLAVPKPRTCSTRLTLKVVTASRWSRSQCEQERGLQRRKQTYLSNKLSFSRNLKTVTFDGKWPLKHLVSYTTWCSSNQLGFSQALNWRTRSPHITCPNYILRDVHFWVNKLLKGGAKCLKQLKADLTLSINSIQHCLGTKKKTVLWKNRGLHTLDRILNNISKWSEKKSSATLSSLPKLPQPSYFNMQLNREVAEIQEVDQKSWNHEIMKTNKKGDWSVKGKPTSVLCFKQHIKMKASNAKVFLVNPLTLSKFTITH